MYKDAIDRIPFPKGIIANCEGVSLVAKDGSANISRSAPADNRADEFASLRRFGGFAAFFAENRNDSRNFALFAAIFRLPENPRLSPKIARIVL